MEVSKNLAKGHGPNSGNSAGASPLENMLWKPRQPSAWKSAPGIFFGGCYIHGCQDLNKKTILWRWGYPAFLETCLEWCYEQNATRTSCDGPTHLFPQESWIPIMEISRTPNLRWERPFCLQQLCSHISTILLDVPKTHLPTLSNFSKLQPIAIGSCGRVAHGTLKCVPSPLTFSWRNNFILGDPNDPKQVNSHKFWETQITWFKYYSITINYQI